MSIRLSPAAEMNSAYVNYMRDKAAELDAYNMGHRYGGPSHSSTSDLDTPTRLARTIRENVKMTVCSHAEGGHGFWGDKRACGRKTETDDRCNEPGPSKDSVIKFLRDRFSISEDDARSKIKELRKAGLIVTYECGAVFFVD